MQFELDRLLAYDTDTILAEVKRVVALIDDPIITRDAFDKLSRVSSSTCLRRFGGWRETLRVVGAEGRYGGKTVSAKMRTQAHKTLTREQIIVELRRVADALGQDTLCREDVRRHSDLLGDRVIDNRFGSWKAALEAAGLKLSRYGRRWTDDDYFDNLLAVWTHYGRCPRYAEMDRPPSRITSGGYAAKFGSWGKAKLAFVERVNSDLSMVEPVDTAPTADRPQPVEPSRQSQAPADRPIRLGLRYEVLRRDRFRCVHCGRSPATDLGCRLHVDHIVPRSAGGPTVADNLRTLCDTCNVGRGARYTD